MKPALRALTLWVTSLLVALVVPAGLRGQLTLTSADSSFKPAWVSSGVAISDLYDGSTSGGNDPSKQSSLNGSASAWDLIGTSTQSVVSVASGTYNFGGGAQNAFLFRVRTADYDSRGPGSGSIVVLFNNGTVASSFGIAVSFTNASGVTPSGFSWVTPSAGTSLTSAFSYSTTAMTAGTVDGSYVQATTISGATNVTLSNYSGTDAYTTFAVLASSLNGAAGRTFSIGTPLTAFTNNNTNLSQINGDWIGSNGVLQFAAVPEPLTWIQFAVFALSGGFVWWHRRHGSGAKCAD